MENLTENDIKIWGFAKEHNSYNKALEDIKKYDFIRNSNVTTNAINLLNNLFTVIAVHPSLNIKNGRFCFNGSCRDKHRNTFWFVVDLFNVYIMHFSVPHKPIYLYDEKLTKKWRAIMAREYEEYREDLTTLLNEEKDKYIESILSELDEELNSFDES